MVFLNTTPIEVLKWKAIDPHFGIGDKHPAARFPATDEGWKDAVTYALQKG